MRPQLTVSMRRPLLLGLTLLLAACATTKPPASPERLAALRAKADGCRGELPSDLAMNQYKAYEVDRFGTVVVTGRTSSGALPIPTKFYDCVFGVGGWNNPTATAPASPAPRPAATTPTAAPAGASNRTADRLQELDTLRQQRLISEEEYQGTRKRILEGL